MKRVDELWIGDQVFTPAGRWETVTNVDCPPGAYLNRVSTDKTGPDYAWVLPGSRELPAVDCITVSQVPTVRVDSNRRHVLAFIGTRDYLYNGLDTVTLVSAYPLGRGEGWQVADRPNGGTDVVTSVVASKAAATSAVKRAARAHAKALGLRMHRPEAGAR